MAVVPAIRNSRGTVIWIPIRLTARSLHPPSTRRNFYVQLEAASAKKIPNGVDEVKQQKRGKDRMDVAHI
jgi:hypothetical protein